MPWRFHFLLVFFLLTLAQAAVAHEIGDPGTRVAPAVKIDTPPVIDGILDDPVWTGIEVHSGFFDVRTDGVAAEQTFVRIAYDDEFIYIAWECLQDETSINATERKYDRFQVRLDDYVQVGFDTFHDHGRAYIFLVSALGTRWDSRDGLFGRNQSWDTDWTAAISIGEDRWFAEMAIPLGVMYHDHEPDQLWGLNFRRRISLQNDSNHWNYNEDASFTFRAQGPKFVADFGHLEGLDLSEIKIDRRPRLETQLYSEWDKQEGGSSASKFGAGFDLEMRLSSHWVSTFSVNPNFSEVDADSGDIQNRDTPRFLEERRSFFNEGAELFRTPINIYNSRSISEIDVAAKITGTGSDWSLASLVLIGEGVDSGEANFLVTRYARNVTDQIQLGTMVVGVDRGNGYDIVAGVDSRIDLSSTVTWSTQFLEQFDEKTEDSGSGPETQTISEHGFITKLEGGSKPFFWFADFQDISPGFAPDLSFIPRQDILGPSLMLQLRDTLDRKYIEGYSAVFRTAYYKNHADNTVLRDFFWEAGIELQNDFDFRASLSENFHDPFDNRTNQIAMNYKRQDRFKSWNTRFSWGTFEETEFEQYDIEKPFKLGDRFTHEFTATFRRENPVAAPDDDVWLWRHVSEYTFENDLRVKLTLQQGSDHSAQQTLLFAYEDVRNWDYFLVLESFRTANKEEVFYGAFTKFAYRW